mgnify:CR=1 FL=1
MATVSILLELKQRIHAIRFESEDSALTAFRFGVCVLTRATQWADGGLAHRNGLTAD